MAKPTVHAYCVCHYGVDYIGWALRSIFPFVEVAHVFYTAHPSHGHMTPASPPEYSIQLYEAAREFDYNNKVRWYQTSNINNEGPQRDMAVKTCQQAGADIVLVCDVDEIWHGSVLAAALELVKAGNARNWLINFTHLWRSFNWCCRDNNWPVRFIDLRQDNRESAYIPKELGEIYHFGYAIRSKILEYKIKIHGHKNEFRPDWLQTKWYAWPPQEDCHPTNGEGWWNPEVFNKWNLPEFMQDHPFFNLERID